MLLGFFVSLAKRSQAAWLRILGEAFSTIFRGLPELLTIFIVYFGASLGFQWLVRLFSDATVEISGFVAGIIALGVVFAAYASEVFTAAFNGIAKGQWEGGAAIGLRRGQTMRLVVFPQLMRLALPGLANLWLILLKDTVARLRHLDQRPAPDDLSGGQLHEAAVLPLFRRLHDLPRDVDHLVLRHHGHRALGGARRAGAHNDAAGRARRARRGGGTVMPDLLQRYGLKLLDGLGVTLELVAISIICGAILAIPIAMARLSKNRIISGIAFGYVYFFRGTPLLAQLFLIYYGAGQFVGPLKAIGLWGFFRDAFNCAAFAFTINTAAYQAEIYRGAIRSVPRGQWEAARSLGLHTGATLLKVVFPQAAIIALRPLGNEIILMIKGSAVASIVTVFDLMGETKLALLAQLRSHDLPLRRGALSLACRDAPPRLESSSSTPDAAPSPRRRARSRPRRLTSCPRRARPKSRFRPTGERRWPRSPSSGSA